MKLLPCPWRSVLLTLLLLTTSAAYAVEPLINVTLEPRQVTLGESAQLTITSSGQTLESTNLPEVQGLEFRVVGQSRRLEIINGATLSTMSLIVRVTPQTSGIFTIPGLTPKSQPLVLRVNPDNGSSSSGNFNYPGRPLPANPNGPPTGLHMAADGAAFVHFNLPKRQVYVGESIPVDIEVGMRAGVVTSLNGLPTLAGGEFTLNNLSRQPERTEKLIDGQPFTLLTWHSVLAPVKPGTFTLSVSTPLTVRIRTRPQRDSMIEDMLGDPFLQNFFGATVAKEISVASQPSDLTVLELPTEGRPADFNGAVGNFKIASQISASSAAAGDPLTLRLSVSGAGNFDRVDTGMLDHLEQWKTYPPKSSFKASDTVGFKGEKTFEQPLIAERPGAQTLPGVSFSYFNPDTRHYETARSAPLEVTIAPSLAESARSAPAPSDSPAASPAAAQPQTGLRPDHAVVDETVTSLVPLYLQARFLILPSLLTLAFAGGWWVTRRRVLSTDGRAGRRTRRSSTVAQVLEQMAAGARSRDSALFFASARAGLQQKLATQWQLAAEQVTPAEIEARLGADGSEIRQIFALADEANYAGRLNTATDFEATDFERWTEIVRRHLERETA